ERGRARKTFERADSGGHGRVSAKACDRAQVGDRFVAGIVRQYSDGKRAVLVRDELARKIFECERASAAVRNQIMQTLSALGNADLLCVRYHVVDRRGDVELVLDPVEDAGRWTTVDRRILRDIQAHQR